jgi:hypothetical protein
MSKFGTATFFYNPKAAAMRIDLSMLNGTVQLEIAESTNKALKGKPKPGDKVYDWDKKVNFSLQPVECCQIDQALPAIFAGTYKNPKATNPQFADVFSIIHFRNEKQSILSLKLAKDKSGKPVEPKTLILTIKPPEPEKKTLSYQFRQEEQAIWGWFIRHGYQRLPFEVAMLGSTERRRAKLDFDAKQQAGRNGQRTPPYEDCHGSERDSPYDDFPQARNMEAPPLMEGPPPAAYDMRPPF